MKNVCIKIIIICMILCVIPINNMVMAVGLPGGVDDSGLGLGDLGKYAGDSGSSEAFDDKINQVISIIQIIASIVSVAVLIVLGIKYMMGSVEAKAEYKRTMIPYLVGAFLVFGITNITSLLYYIATHVFE